MQDIHAIRPDISWWRQKTKELLISSYYGFLHLHDALFYPPPPASNPTRVAPSIYSAAFLSEQGEGKVQLLELEQEDFCLLTQWGSVLWCLLDLASVLENDNVY